jgi:hypothetical protein
MITYSVFFLSEQVFSVECNYFRRIILCWKRTNIIASLPGTRVVHLILLIFIIMFSATFGNSFVNSGFFRDKQIYDSSNLITPTKSSILKKKMRLHPHELPIIARRSDDR